MTFSIHGQVIAVCGGGSGIGLAVCELLASRGAIVSIGDINEKTAKNAQATISKSGGQCCAWVVDVRDTASVDAWIINTIKNFGRLDGAVNSAGVLRKAHTGSPVTDLDDEDWNFVIDINLTGTFRCMRAQLAHLEQGGSIVNICSSGGAMGVPFDSAYSASKHGLIGLTKSVAKETAARNIRINCISPGVVETEMLITAAGKPREQLSEEIKGHTPLNRMAATSEIASMVEVLLGKESSFVTGAVIAVDGGMTS